MLRLNLSRGPAWLDLRHGVRVEVLPLNTEMRMRASRAITGPDGTMEPDSVLRDVAYTKAIARSAIIAWEGVGDESGQIAPLSPDGVDALLDIYDFYHEFHAKYVIPGILVESEGNGSAPLPNGTSERAKATATRAKPRARSARKSSTPPKP
ncbi:hypothetical protein QCN27_03905 [Cereibacter sp. SYSU M97828]|nr:hypothetical protein [Cereibacter flavus]